MKSLNKYVGLDVHKDTTVIAVAEDGRTGEQRVYGTISSDLHALERALRKLGGPGVPLHLAYETGCACADSSLRPRRCSSPNSAICAGALNPAT